MKSNSLDLRNCFIISCLVFTLIPLTIIGIGDSKAQNTRTYIPGDIYLLSESIPKIDGENTGPGILHFHVLGNANGIPVIGFKTLLQLPWRPGASFSYDAYRDMLIVIMAGRIYGVESSGNYNIIAHPLYLPYCIAARGDGIIYVYNKGTGFQYVDAMGNVYDLSGADRLLGENLKEMFYHAETNSLFLGRTIYDPEKFGNERYTAIIKMPLDDSGTRVESKIDSIMISVSKENEGPTGLSYGPIIHDLLSPLGKRSLFVAVDTNSGDLEPHLLKFDPYQMISFEPFSLISSPTITGIYSRICKGAIVLDAHRNGLYFYMEGSVGNGIHLADTEIRGATKFLEIDFGITNDKQIIISSPSKDEVLISGEYYEIKWLSTGVDSVNLYYSTDGGINYKQISINLPDTNSYKWYVPDELSTRCRIKIEYTRNPSIYDESELFRMKGYILTRVNSDSLYEAFNPIIDGWSFKNSKKNMWPGEWWGQFSYEYGIDPHTLQRYPIEFMLISAKPSDFPDWPLFVQSFGVEQTYYQDGLAGLIHSPTALLGWASIKDEWGGSCLGFAVSSLQVFDFPEDFINTFPEVGNIEILSLLPLNNSIRKVINQLWVYQFGEIQKEHIIQSYIKRPKNTLEDIKQMLLSEHRNDRYLGFYNNHGSGAHAVVPYKVERHYLYSDWEWIYIYDNNFPGDSTKRILIDTYNNSWYYDDMPGWGGNHGFFLSDPVSNYLNHPIFSEIVTSQDRRSASSKIVTFYNSKNAFITITDPDSNTIGYSDSLCFNHIQNAIPLIPITGNFHPPIGYHVPKNRYSVIMKSFTDSTTYFSAFNDSIVYSYNRSDAYFSQTDNLYCGEGFSVFSKDNQKKSISLKAIIKEDSEKVFDILNAELIQNDSIHFEVSSHENLKVVYFGAAKAYDLRIKLVASSADLLFEHSAIPVKSNETHYICPVWENLEDQPVKILIDIGNDDTFDDSLFVENQLTFIKNKDYKHIPSKYDLLQNYPNPFNSTTKIEFVLGREEIVVLRVYNTLGEEVETLIHGKYPAGNHEITWNADHFPSGVYFYVLRTKEYTQTRKMILMR
ncbi:MAG: T9SS type A sorting domain-containing protein [Candidatus Lokiarchaeota archaeon]|nr:T9SS type A sorting domain-containing protein [Candidatus Lokiarchaeota archaeon]